MPIVHGLPAAVVWPMCGYLHAHEILQLRVVSQGVLQCLSSKPADESIWKARCQQLAAGAHAGMVLASLIKPVHEPHFYVSAAVHFSSRTLFRQVALEPRQRLPLSPGTNASASGGSGGSSAAAAAVGAGASFLAAGMLEVPSACTDDGRVCEVVQAIGVVSLMPPLPDHAAAAHENAGAARLTLAYQALCRDYRDPMGPPVSSQEAGCEKFDKLPTPHSSAALSADAAAPPCDSAAVPTCATADAPQRAAAARLARRVVGLYFAVYGPHGLELISVGWSRGSGGGALRGLKATGDVNVPAGRLTFESVGALSTPPFAVPPCTCGFECECFGPAEAGHITLLGKMDARARTAQTGFVSPTWNDATIVLFDAREEWAHYSASNPAAARMLEAPISARADSTRAPLRLPCARFAVEAPPALPSPKKTGITPVKDSGAPPRVQAARAAACPEALVAPTGCLESAPDCSVGILVIWRGEGFSTSMRFRPFCP
ncbi:hypothetical protein JKP88DRAFT_347541 [Tribonema minus]|uniref:F-box domain-containing protein n=1 Tax=Tribonema minus TaxID=303371 RepID=A0A836CKV8_9STRA|nr:hypothetical protein JKP88DRAFT_347541 [Tribonema minus]